VVGVGFEARGLRRRLDLPRPGTEEPHGALILRTAGLGAATLAPLAADAARWRSAAVLVTGLAGGCAPAVRPGDLVVGHEVGSRAGGPWRAADPGLLAQALRTLRSIGLPHHAGRLVTVSGVLATPADKARCWEQEAALAVDMESSPVLEWATRAGLPAVAVRVVADGPGEILPPSVAAALDPAGRLRAGRVLAWAGRPDQLRHAWRLWRCSTLALDRLARFLSAFAGAPREP
jgi:nucleoside phosphorylase